MASFRLSRVAAFAPVLAVASLLMSCNENFGTPPLPLGEQSIAVRSQGFAGPVGSQAAVSLAGTAAGLLLGTDRGSYRLLPGDGSLRWEPGPPRLGFLRLDRASVARGGAVWFAGAGLFLYASPNAGDSWEQVIAPGSDLVGLAAMPPSPFHASGALLTVIGVVPQIRPVDEVDWSAADIPRTPQAYGPFDADAAGRVACAVLVGGEWRLWRSEDGGASFTELPYAPDGMPLDLILDSGGELAYATATSIVHGATRVDATTWGAVQIKSVDLAWIGDAIRVFALVGPALGGASDAVAFGLADSPPAAIALPGSFDEEAGVVATGGGGWAVTDVAEMWSLDGGNWLEFGFAGGIPDVSTAAADPAEPGTVYLSGSLAARVWRGVPGGELEDLQSPQRGEVRALLPDPAGAGAVYSGSTGTQVLLPGAPRWAQRSEGQASYQCDILFGGPVLVQTLGADPATPGEIWLGALLGDGVYRTLDGGLNWSRVHDGLGQPNPLDCDGETGLSGLTQARAFAFVDGEVWMGGFRGGVHRLDRTEMRWEQRNRGLPDIFGNVVDSCCFEPLIRSVDIRDLAVLDDGSLLAATGFGIYRDDGRAGSWELSSNGLGSFDVYQLAVHPNRSGWVLAGSHASSGVPDWLFLSQDGGRSWVRVETAPREQRVRRLLWSDPRALEALAILEGAGAWRMELAP